MHELGITQEIVEIAVDRASGAPIKRILVEIGRLTAVLPDAVRFCFEVCAEGTAASGARLDIVEVPARGRCRACGTEQVLAAPFGICDCGQTDFDWLSGEELRVMLVEVD